MIGEIFKGLTSVRLALFLYAFFQIKINGKINNFFSKVMQKGIRKMKLLNSYVVTGGSYYTII